MKELLIRYSEQQESFILELMERLGVDYQKPYEIPEEEKQIVRERIARYKANPSTAQDLDAALNEIEQDV